MFAICRRSRLRGPYRPTPATGSAWTVTSTTWSPSGFGDVLAGGFEAADAFIGRLRYSRRSASLGGGGIAGRASGAAPSTYRVSQGARVGRAGTVEITADPDGAVWVGGAATVCIRGSITL
jgi:hypothetical protein